MMSSAEPECECITGAGRPASEAAVGDAARDGSAACAVVEEGVAVEEGTKAAAGAVLDVRGEIGWEDEFASAFLASASTSVCTSASASVCASASPARSATAYVLSLTVRCSGTGDGLPPCVVYSP